MYSCPVCDSLLTFDLYGDPQCRCNTNTEGGMNPVLRRTLIAITVVALCAWLWIYSPAV